MEKKTVSGIMLTILLVGLLTLAFGAPHVRAETITVPDDLPTIQAAINAASSGDTVLVKMGTYHESVVVNKSISLIGEATVIEEPEGSGIIITADSVTVRGFTILNSRWGIWVKSSGCLITENSLIGNLFEGVFLDGREGTVVGNTVTNNFMMNNSGTGILIWGSNGNSIKFNTVKANAFGVYFYSFESPTGNNFVGGNTIIDNEDDGLVLNMGCSNNVIVKNEISNNGWKGFCWTSGIVLNVNCKSNVIVGNNVTNNAIGVYQYYSSNDNAIHHNSFINNRIQVFNDKSFPSANVWDNGYPSGGNYWSNYDGADLYSGPYQNVTGSDGIGDTPYIVDSNGVDHYPLMNPYDPPVVTGDLNDDLKVDIRDVALVALAMGSYPGSHNWNPMADVNNDGKVDIRDVALVAKNFGKTFP